MLEAFPHVSRPPGARVEWRISRRDGTPLAVEGNGHGKVFVKSIKRKGRTAWGVWNLEFSTIAEFSAFQIEQVKK